MCDWVLPGFHRELSRCVSFLLPLGRSSLILDLLVACQLGCSQCADQTGDCISCASGFTQDSSDATKCDATPQTSSDGTTCPDGSFSSSGTCTPCSTECKTCNGGTSNNCIVCGSGKVSLNGSCVTTDGNGVCEGSNLIANNNKNECDSECPRNHVETCSRLLTNLMSRLRTRMHQMWDSEFHCRFDD